MPINVKKIRKMWSSGKAIEFSTDGVLFRLSKKAAVPIVSKHLSIFIMDNTSKGSSKTSLPLVCIATEREVMQGEEPDWETIKNRSLTTPLVDKEFLRMIDPDGEGDETGLKSSEVISRGFVFRVSSESFATLNQKKLRLYQYGDGKYVLCTEDEMKKCQKLIQDGKLSFSDKTDKRDNDKYGCINFMDLRKIKFVNDSLFGMPTDKLDAKDLEETED